jgi:hypothetical protein
LTPEEIQGAAAQRGWHITYEDAQRLADEQEQYPEYDILENAADLIEHGEIAPTWTDDDSPVTSEQVDQVTTADGEEYYEDEYLEPPAPSAEVEEFVADLAQRTAELEEQLGYDPGPERSDDARQLIAHSVSTAAAEAGANLRPDWWVRACELVARGEAEPAQAVSYLASEQDRYDEEWQTAFDEQAAAKAAELGLEKSGLPKRVYQELLQAHAQAYQEEGDYRDFEPNVEGAWLDIYGQPQNPEAIGETEKAYDVEEARVRANMKHDLESLRNKIGKHTVDSPPVTEEHVEQRQKEYERELEELQADRLKSLEDLKRDSAPAPEALRMERLAEVGTEDAHTPTQNELAVQAGEKAPDEALTRDETEALINQLIEGTVEGHDPEPEPRLAPDPDELMPEAPTTQQADAAVSDDGPIQLDGEEAAALEEAARRGF